MAKRLPNWLKIGVQAGFGPKFTMEFEAEIPKKFGLAYSSVGFTAVTKMPLVSALEGNLGEYVSSNSMLLPKGAIFRNAHVLFTESIFISEE